jgi:hypothetical protein
MEPCVREVPHRPGGSGSQEFGIARGRRRTSQEGKTDPGLGSRFAGLYARRNDSESINRDLDDSMWLGRAHSIGHARQHVNLIGYALMVNSLALFEHRRRRPPSLASVA